VRLRGGVRLQGGVRLMKANPLLQNMATELKNTFAWNLDARTF
jgi:hypothetical protein